MLKIKCSKCNFIFYEGGGYESETFVSPHEVIVRNAGKCPQCGKELSYNPQKRIKNAKIRIF